MKKYWEACVLNLRCAFCILHCRKAVYSKFKAMQLYSVTVITLRQQKGAAAIRLNITFELFRLLSV